MAKTTQSNDDPLKDVPVSIDGFHNCGWKKIIQGENGKDCDEMHRAFSVSVKKAIDDKKLAEAKVLQLFSSACSMALLFSAEYQDQDQEEPFAPLFTSANGWRTVIPEDFTAEHIRFFAEVVEEIDNPILRARIADILWLNPNSKNQKYALLAIDEYCKFTIGAGLWNNESEVCCDRAIQLCRTLKKDARDKLAEIEKSLLEEIKQSSPENEGNTLRISRLFLAHGLGGKNFSDIAKKLEELAIGLKKANNLYDASWYFEESEKFYKKLKSQDKHAEITIAIAEIFVERAESCQSSKPPDYIAAAFWYKDAIAKYESIDKTQKEKHDIGKLIKRLFQKFEQASKKSLGQMATIKSSEIDLSILKTQAKENIKGKELREAMFSLICIMTDVNVVKLREFTEEMIEKHPLQADMPITKVSSDGIMIAQCDGFNPMSDDNEVRIKVEMVRYYEMRLGIRTRGVWFGFEAMKEEHSLTEDDFYEIVSHSIIVPEERARLVAKGLFAGYDNDFVAALYILIPQLENIVRYHLKLHGVQTKYMRNGGYLEKGLGSLLNSEAETVEKAFGADVAFELNALFCHPFGPNLRNELAHGLLSDEESQSEYSLYVWWFILRLVYKYFYLDWKRANEQANKDKEQE